jgi:hypothetical protein
MNPSGHADALPSGLWPALVGPDLRHFMVLVFIRFGLLAVAAEALINIWLNTLPITTNLSAKYAGTSLFVIFMAIAGRVCLLHLAGRAETVQRKVAVGLRK